MAQVMLWGMLLMAMCFWLYTIALVLYRVRTTILQRESHAAWVHTTVQEAT
jgi:heme exporter protein C